MSSERVAARALALRRHLGSDPGLQLIRKDMCLSWLLCPVST